jgi:hypothetical protein
VNPEDAVAFVGRILGLAAEGVNPRHMGWQTTETMRQWLRFLGSLPEYADMHVIHLIIDGYAAHRSDVVRELAGKLCISLHFVPPGLAGILQPLDRAAFGALQAEYRAIYGYEMSQREDKSMTEADFAAYLLLAWELVSEDAIHRGWGVLLPSYRGAGEGAGCGPWRNEPCSVPVGAQCFPRHRGFCTIPCPAAGPAPSSETMCAALSIASENRPCGR